MLPLVGAIAAGCPAVVKPSELSSAVSGLLADLFPRYLDPVAYVLVQGAVPETTRLLEFRWGHIMYTGSGRVGRIVAAAAAKHVTPVTLELGGKSPVIIAPDCDVELAAKRVLFGKVQNSGQVRFTCGPRQDVPLLTCSSFYSSVYRRIMFWCLNRLQRHSKVPLRRLTRPSSPPTH